MTRFDSNRMFVATFVLALASAMAHSVHAAGRPDIAVEDVIVDAPLSPTDKRNVYTDKLLLQVLRRTEKTFGPFTLRYAEAYMERDRLLLELTKGTLINVSAQATQPAWENQLTAIRVPVDLGLSSWRVSLIRQENQDMLRRVNTVEELKRLTLGVGSGWSSFKVFEANGFMTVTGSNYDGLFEMLISNRFIHFPRGINEVFVEFDDRIQKNSTLAIESSFALYFPFPKYFFVSPTNPRLADRLRRGLRDMVADGSLCKLMMDSHAGMIKQAEFCKRKLFRIANPLLSPQTPLDQTALWFDPLDPKNGVCKTRTKS